MEPDDEPGDVEEDAGGERPHFTLEVHDSVLGHTDSNQ